MREAQSYSEGLVINEDIELLTHLLRGSEHCNSLVRRTIGLRLFDTGGSILTVLALEKSLSIIDLLLIQQSNGLKNLKK